MTLPPQEEGHGNDGVDVSALATLAPETRREAEQSTGPQPIPTAAPLIPPHAQERRVFARPQGPSVSPPGGVPQRAVPRSPGESSWLLPGTVRSSAQVARSYANMVGQSTTPSYSQRLNAWIDVQVQHLMRLFREQWTALALDLLGWVAGIGVALAAAYLLVAKGIDSTTSNELVATGFDVDRARMITAFCLALLASGASGLVVLRRGVAWLGGFVWFVEGYLWPLFQQSQHPSTGGGGQPLVTPGTLAHVMLTLAALGILFTGVGAVLGEGVGRMVIPPLAAIGRTLINTVRRTQPSASPASVRAIARPLAAAALVAAALAIGVPQVGSLLSYGVTTQLYQPPAEPSSQQGTVEQGSYVSPALGGATRNFMIYLPPSYSLPANQTVSYPTIYLLHGSPGGYTDWFSAGHAAAAADNAAAFRVARDTIIVSPDGNGTIYRTSAWANSYDNKQRMEDAIATDLVAYIDSHYRTLADPADRAIGGLSEGGYGAANIALHRPDVFSKVMSLDGFFETTNSQVFGPYGSGYRNYNSPSTYLQTPQGQKAGHQLSFIVAVGKTDAFYNDGIAFVKKLQAQGIPVQLLETDGGHNWAQWSQQFVQSLPLLAAIPRRHKSTNDMN